MGDGKDGEVFRLPGFDVGLKSFCKSNCVPC